MTYYSQVYDVILELFGDYKKITGTNEDENAIKLNSFGLPINYDLRVVTPFVATRIEFKDKDGNNIYVIFPKIKAAHRAIDKLVKEIGKDINKKVSEDLDGYWNSENRESFSDYCEDSLGKSSNKTTELHDITRLTITRKYLSGVDHLDNLLNKHEEAHNYTTGDPRNRFEMPLYENSKLYFDSKVIIELVDDTGKPFDAEIELKLDTLCHADDRTHENYEKYRRIIESITESDPNRKTKEDRAEKLEKQNREININATHEYNMIVLDKIQRKINKNLKHRRRKEAKSDGTYNECNDFITNNYLVDSYEAFDPQTAFNPQHYSNGKPCNKMCFLKLVGLLPKKFDEFTPDADKIVEETFNSIYDESDPQKYKEFHFIRKQYRDILNIAQKYSNEINNKIVDKIVNDLAEAQSAFVINEENIEDRVKSNKLSTGSKKEIKDSTEQYLSSIYAPLKNFEPQEAMGKICILKLLRRLPKDFPKCNNKLKTKDFNMVQQIYTDIFNNSEDKDHALLSRLLKIAINKKEDVQNKLNEKMKHKTFQILSKTRTRKNNKTLSPELRKAMARTKLSAR